MKRICQLNQLTPNDRGGALTIGNFDGVHRGHVRLIERLVAHARDVNGPAVVFTFDPHPANLLRPNSIPLPLTTIDKKAELLAQLGVDILVVYPTDRHLLDLSPEAFFQEIVLRKLGAKAVVEGPNFYFGKDRAGDVVSLSELCATNQLALEIVNPIAEPAGGIISSSRVRSELATGNLKAVTAMLNRPFQLTGKVTMGAQRGRTIGFPTANLAEIQTWIPAPGVYAGRVVVDGEAYAAAINIGSNPTFSDDQDKVEVHVIGFHGQLYGTTLEVDFLVRLRDIHTFESVESLTKQLHVDVAAAREMFVSQAPRRP